MELAPELDRLLAQANVHRLRRQYAEARETALKVLQEDPKNVDAHRVLGDLAYDQDKLDEAKEWYELTRDLAPNSPADADRLALIVRRLESQNGAPSGTVPKPKTALVAILAVAFLASVIFASYLAGQSGAGSKADPLAVVDSPTELGNPKYDPPVKNPSTQASEVEKPVPSESIPVAQPNEDDDSSRFWQKRLGPDVLSAIRDPRGPSLILTLKVGEKSSAESVAAAQAGAALEADSNLVGVAVRVQWQSTVIYAADLRRDDWANRGSADPVTLLRRVWKGGAAAD